MNTKNCPYCGIEMEKGTFHSRGMNSFWPDGERPGWYSKKAMKKSRCIMLPPDPYRLSVLADERLYGYLCRRCKMIMIPYEDE